MAKFKIGDNVKILGISTVLKTPISDTDGGWIVEPMVQGVRYWNEDEITPETRGEKLVRNLYESDEANVLTNRAARFIERLLITGSG